MPGRFRDLADLRIAYSTSDRPIRTFYIPVLSRAVLLDRIVGYFTAGGLALYAGGLVGFVKNGGRMRLLVGAQLQAEDVEAIAAGEDLVEITRRRLLDAFEAPTAEIEIRRLEILAWMIAAGTLEIKVGVPRDPRTGRPLAAPEADGYFHAKSGVARDAHGDKVGWMGSNNDTVAANVSNYEQFMVHASWEDGQRYTDWIETSFGKLWENKDPDWITITIPQAVERRLLEYTPPEAPTDEPGEEEEPGSVDKEAVIAAWLRDAPYLVEVGRRLGRATANIQPWPHQERVAEDIVSGFPDRFLLADEVGLGKTIEVGLALRDLTLSGVVKRCLILAPRSVLNQWKDELREKFLLIAREYDGPESLGNESLVLVSSQLAKRRERRQEFLNGPDWDLVVIDEAHHARRKGFKDSRRRPNRLLELLEGVDHMPGLAAKTRGLLLLTATPMQVHALEVWDLLAQLGLPGRWGASGDYFLRYFEALRKAGEDWKSADWDLVVAMAGDERAYGGDTHSRVADPLKHQIGWARWEHLCDLVKGCDGAGIRSLGDDKDRAAALAMFRHLTPLRRRMRRFTRTTLREYRQKGLLPGRLADRMPDPRWVEMTPEEREVYDRIEEYISDFYRKYEDERKGLGFVMTVYRRRLTSSFYALERSLERRLDFLRGKRNQEWLTDEDTEEDDLQDDVQEVLGDTSTQVRFLFGEEMEYVESFLGDLRNLGSDNKYSRLVDDLDEALSRRDSVVIFTQYADTMDYLRERLRHVYGTRIACYSGRGGERWSGHEWEELGKERIKQDFAERRIAILLGTDAMAEGLNLQTCGVEINYDVPWNPMRLEQRIGRIDRIGQTFDTVWIWSYFLEGTIEAEVYRRLVDRIDWFTGVVGPVQPILHRVGEAVKALALMSRDMRTTRLDQELRDLESAIDRAEREGLDFDDHLANPDALAIPAPPVTGPELEDFMVGSSAIGHRFRRRSDLADTYNVNGQGVTFRHKVADQHPETLRLLTFGDPLFSQLLAEFPDPAEARFGIARVESLETASRQVGWYHDSEPGPTTVDTMADLKKAIGNSVMNPEIGTDAESAFVSYLEDQLARQDKANSSRRAECISAWREEGRGILKKATYVWLARRDALFGTDNFPITGQAVTSMIQTEAFPFAPLANLLGIDFQLSAADPEWQAVASKSRPSLDGMLQQLRHQAEPLVDRLATATQYQPHLVAGTRVQITVC